MQQLQSRGEQIRREPGDADPDSVHVVQIGLFGPAVLGAGSGAAPECRPEESRAAGRVADRDGGVIDAEKGAGAIDGAPFPRYTSLREGEQFQRVAVMITELERRHAPGAVRQPHRAVTADRPEPPVGHDQLICVPHVVHDDRHVLEPEVGARAAGRIRTSRRVHELQQLDPLAAQPQHRAPPARLPDAQHADQRRIDVAALFGAAPEGPDVVVFGPVQVRHDQGDPVDQRSRPGPHAGIGLSLRTAAPMCSWRALTTRAKWLNAWGVLPSWRCAHGSHSSLSSPTSLRRPSRRSNRPIASRRWPDACSASTSQNEQAMNRPSLPLTPSSVWLVE